MPDPVEAWRDVIVLIPVLNRPERVAPLLQSLTLASEYTKLTPLWLVSRGDSPEKKALLKAGQDWLEMTWKAGPGDYARKMNFGLAHARACGHRYAFLGADDLMFHPGWAERVIARNLETGACVVGTNDMGNSRVKTGIHSTHSLIHLGYLECGSIDDPSRLLHEGYDHNFVDDELVATAKHRGVYAHASDSLVEHLHPSWGKATTDSTYMKGVARFAEDRRKFQARQALWA